MTSIVPDKKEFRNRLVNHEKLVDDLQADTAALREAAATTKTKLVDAANGAYKNLAKSLGLKGP